MSERGRHVRIPTFWQANQCNQWWLVYDDVCTQSMKIVNVRKLWGLGKGSPCWTILKNNKSSNGEKSEKFWGNSCAVSLCLVAIVHPHPPNDLFWHCPTCSNSLQPLLSGRFMHFSSCPRMLHYKRPDRARRSPLPCWLLVMNRWLSYHSRRIPRPRFFGTELNQVLAYLHV